MITNYGISGNPNTSISNQQITSNLNSGLRNMPGGLPRPGLAGVAPRTLPMTPKPVTGGIPGAPAPRVLPVQNRTGKFGGGRSTAHNVMGGGGVGTNSLLTGSSGSGNYRPDK